MGLCPSLFRLRRVVYSNTLQPFTRSAQPLHYPQQSSTSFMLVHSGHKFASRHLGKYRVAVNYCLFSMVTISFPSLALEPIQFPDSEKTKGQLRPCYSI